MNRAIALVLLATPLAACSGAGEKPSPGPGTKASYMDGQAAHDVIRLTNGEVIRGRIIEENAKQVVIEREEQVSVYPRAAVYSVDYSKESFKARTQGLRASEPSAASPRPASSWYPRTDPRERVEQVEVLWHERHPWTDCLGPDLTRSFQKFPDLRLFAAPGGKIVFHDPRKWGYHSHLFPGDPDRMQKPVDNSGLTIPMPVNEAEFPDAVAFVSPSQETKSTEAPERTGYVLPDVLYGVVRPLSAAGAILAVQPFTGGKPAPTRNGSLWAFALPRNSAQFYVYLVDAEAKHSELLKGAFVGYGDTILAADFMVDSLSPDGGVVGRVLAVPYPDGLSPDGPAAEPLTVYSGPPHDPTAMTSVAVPPRQTVQRPSQAPSTKLAILVSHYEVSRDVPQSMGVAYGTGRPTSDVRLIERALEPETADELVKIDLSSLPEERFPAVVWFHHRRTYAWKSAGGYLPPAPDLALPPLRPTKLTKVKRSDPIPHVLPILFQGPRPRPVVAGADPAAGIAGGMSNAVMSDALAREAGRGLSGLTANLAPTASLTPGGGGGNVTSVTYVNIIGPQHTADSGVTGGSYTGPSGLMLSTYGGWPSNVGISPQSAQTMAPLGPVQYQRDAATGVVRDAYQNVVYDPRTGSTTSTSPQNRDDLMMDQWGSIITPLRRRR